MFSFCFQAGIFFGGTGKQLGYQLYGVIVYFAWAFGTSMLLFGALRVAGWLRVSREVEIMGMGTCFVVKVSDDTVSVRCYNELKFSPIAFCHYSIYYSQMNITTLVLLTAPNP